MRKKTPDGPSASIGVECWFEYAASHRETLESGLRVVVDDPTDERWAGEMTKPPFRAGAEGYLGVYRVTRVDGEAVKKELLVGRHCHKNFAREFMQQFIDAKEAGAEKPWDLEHFHRDRLEQAKAAAKEGRQSDLQDLAAAFRDALAGTKGNAVGVS